MAKSPLHTIVVSEVKIENDYFKKGGLIAVFNTLKAAKRHLIYMSVNYNKLGVYFSIQSNK